MRATSWRLRPATRPEAADPPIRSSVTDRASASVLSERHGAADVTFQPGTPFPGGVRPVVSGQS
jgi:hypothetical protein